MNHTWWVSNPGPDKPWWTRGSTAPVVPARDRDRVIPRTPVAEAMYSGDPSRLLDLAKSAAGLAVDFSPLGDAKALLWDAPREFVSGHPGMGLLALASAVPGIPGLPRIIRANPSSVPRLSSETFRGVTGNKDHITMVERGTIPTDALADLRGAKGEVRGAHRNRLGADWDSFKADISDRGIQEPLFVTVDYDGSPLIAEGNHRLDAALELGLAEVPVEIRYFGNAQNRGTVFDRFLEYGRR